MSKQSGFTRIVLAGRSIQRGLKPHIYVYGAKYTNQMLEQSPDLIGRRITVSIDPEDLRSVGALTESGEDLGMLHALPPWHLTPHTLEMRHALLFLERRRMHSRVKTSDPIIRYLDYIEKQSAKGGAVPTSYLELRRLYLELHRSDQLNADSMPYERPAEE
jgi:hypothetical protein